MSVWLGPVIEWLGEFSGFCSDNLSSRSEAVAAESQYQQLIQGLSDSQFLPKPKPREQKIAEQTVTRSQCVPLRVLWVTPLRALASDTEKSLREPVINMNLPWSVETRTGDTNSATRQRQDRRLPTALITTPESLSLFLSKPNAKEIFKSLRCVIVDEWHELLSTKRGVQTELALARLRNWLPTIQTWGLSATLGNVNEAASYLTGLSNGNRSSSKAVSSQILNESSSKKLDESSEGTTGGYTVIRGAKRKRYEVKTVIPESMERFPWAGHLGIKLLPQVVARIDEAGTTLLFTNTRSQTETWYRQLLKHRPDWAGKMAIHHGSLDHSTRGWVEEKLKERFLKCVVCTSTLELGVDFSPVEQVIQVGSPKGIARLIQRAGRSGHDMQRVSRVLCVPTHGLELVEFSAARNAIKKGTLEARVSKTLAIDVLTQHVSTIAAGGGFLADELFDEVKQTNSFRDLDRSTWDWILSFITTGGESLHAYPNYHKVKTDSSNRYSMTDPKIVRFHRLSIGTIVSDGMLNVSYLKGKRLGQVEENFIAKLSPGDTFVFAGKVVEFARLSDGTVWVRRAKSQSRPKVPRWMGGRMPLSTELSNELRINLDEAARGTWKDQEMRTVRPLLELQQHWSAIPRLDEFLIEQIKTRDGFHTFFYPFAGRLVHEGLAALFAYRYSLDQPSSFSMSINDYGFELLSRTKPNLSHKKIGEILATDSIDEHIGICANQAELAKRKFREIATISGLVFTGYPSGRKTAKQLQASSGLLFDVFREYDATNRLLAQADEEVLEQQLQKSRLLQTMNQLRSQNWIIETPKRLTPLCFPLLVDRLRSRLSSESLSNRIERLLDSLEREATKDMKSR